MWGQAFQTDIHLPSVGHSRGTRASELHLSVIVSAIQKETKRQNLWDLILFSPEDKRQTKMYTVPILILTVIVSLAGAKFYSPNQYNLYKAGASPHHGQGNPTGRHK